LSSTPNGEDAGAGEGPPPTLDELKGQMGAESVEAVESPPWRQIIIETNGNGVRIVKAEVAGNIELVAILRALVDQFSMSARV